MIMLIQGILNVLVFPDYCALFLSSSPSYAIPKLLDKTGLKLADIDVFEYHEAFAVSVCSLQCSK